GDVAAGDLLFRRPNGLAAAHGAEQERCQPAGPSVVLPHAIHAIRPPGTPTSAQPAPEGSIPIDRPSGLIADGPVPHGTRSSARPVGSHIGGRLEPVRAGSVLTRHTIGTIGGPLKSKTGNPSVIGILGEIAILPVVVLLRIRGAGSGSIEVTRRQSARRRRR